ncbi:MAG: ribosome small subunit-dependent GTPase A [Chloroflexota bacterium]
MELVELGFTDWFREGAPENTPPGGNTARVTAVDRGGYLVRGTGGEVFAELSGNFMFSLETGADYPVVGDWVCADFHNDNSLAIIHALFPRKTFLRRKTAGKKVDYQMIAANIDTALIVQSCDFNFNLRRLERYLVMVREGGIRPLVLLSKSDLVSPEGLEQRIAAIKDTGFKDEVIGYSINTGSGLPQVRQALQPGNTYCLLGSSGVGKTTLLNHLIGQEEFKTNLVREKDGRGRHTTARRQLVVLEGGAMLVDTPGMRELGNIATDAGIDESFADILELAARCRFNDCTHTGETGCAVLAAIRTGELGEDRYQSYLKLVRESAHYQMSYLEKRQKDRKFGQFVKSVMKHHKKR